MVKSHIHYINVQRYSRLKVVFSEEVTLDEAIDLYMDGDYDDILDEEDFGTEVV